MELQLEEMLLNLLPHGSGIDYDWTFEETEGGFIECYNTYCAMDEMGGYCCEFGFTATLQLKGEKYELIEVEISDEVECEFCESDEGYLNEYLTDTVDNSILCFYVEAN